MPGTMSLSFEIVRCLLWRIVIRLLLVRRLIRGVRRLSLWCLFSEFLLFGRSFGKGFGLLD